MPLIENDTVFANLIEYDSNPKTAETIFEKLGTGQMEAEMSSLNLVEMELIFRSQKRKDKLLDDLAALAAPPRSISV